MALISKINFVDEENSSETKWLNLGVVAGMRMIS